MLDLKTPDGRETLRALIAGADVVVHSFAPGVAERMGIGPRSWTALNPRLDLLRAVGLRSRGPQGHRRGPPVRVRASWPPTAVARVPVPMHDMIAPWIMVAGVLAALLERERSGRGQVVETSLLESSAALAVHRLIREESGEPLFNRFVGALYRPYATADGGIAAGLLRPADARAGAHGDRPRATCSTTRASPSCPRGPGTPTRWPPEIGDPPGRAPDRPLARRPARRRRCPTAW